MKRIITVSLVLIIAVGAVVLLWNTSPKPDYGTMSFETIAGASYGSLEEETSLVVQTAEEFSALGLDVPAPDFSSQTVLVVALGMRSTGGYDIQITSVTEKRALVVVEVTRTSPGSTCDVTQAFTSPYHVVVTDKIIKSVSFRYHNKVLSC